MGDARIPASDDFVVAGKFVGILDVPGFPIATSHAQDIFVARLDNVGKLLWLKTFGGAGADTVAGIAADAEGNIFLTGSFSSPSIDFGGPTLTNADVAGAGSSDVYVAWLDGSGAHVFSTRFGDGASQGASGIALDGTGHLVLSGAMAGTTDFGGHVLKANTKSDLFVVRLSR